MVLKIQLDEIEVFVSAVDLGNYVSAANALNITSSVVSRTIKKLERKLNTTLFNRTTRKIYLTQEGQWLYDNINSVIAQVQSVESYFNDETRQPAGKLIIDAATPFTLHAIGPLIAGFNQLYPDITITLQSSESRIDLIDHGVDVAIRIGELEDSSLRAKKLGDCFRQIYAAPKYINIYGYPKKASQLKQHACLGFSQEDVLNTWPLADGSEKKMKITPRILADSGETLRQLAIKGCGVVCISSFTAKDDVLAGNLVPVLEKQTIKIPIPVYAVFYAKAGINRRLRCFLDYVSENIRLI